MHDADATAALEKLRAAVARVERGEVDDLGRRTLDPAPPADSHATDHAGPLPAGAPPWGDLPAGPPPPDPAAGADDEPAKDPYAVARAIVLRQLTNAPKTRQQLRDVLAKRECQPDVAEAVLDRMAEVGLVDDAAYAQMLVRSKQTGRGLARRALSHELRTKGVDDQTAADVLEAIDPEQERSRARQLVDKRLASMHGLEVSVQTRRLAGMLARKGYAGDMAWAVIRDALADSPEHQRD